MRLNNSVPKLRLAMLLGAVTGLATGCVFTLGSGDPSTCGGTFSNSSVQDDGTCACDLGYDWKNPSDENDYECEALDSCVSGSNNHVSQGSGDCVCDGGFEWCEPGDPDDLNCCEIVGGETSGSGEATSGDGDGDGDSSTSGDGDGDNLPPETCTPEEEGLEWCTKDTGDNLAGSRYFFCIEGTWQEFPNFLDETCVDEGNDFAYGCEFDGSANTPVCGVGSGAACSNDDAATCLDATNLEACLHERLGTTDCQIFCENGSANGLGEDFELGECTVVEGVADCTCSNPN